MRLWVIRHAKSDWNSAAQSDFERPLNARGQRDGPRMANWLADQPAPAEWIWTSTAVRARSTATFVANGFASGHPEVITDQRLYLAGPEQLLAVLQETADTINSVAIVAHNPGLTELINLLAGEPLLDNLPTFGVAAFEVTTPWVDLRFGRVKLTTLMSPRKLGDHGG